MASRRCCRCQGCDTCRGCQWCKDSCVPCCFELGFPYGGLDTYTRSVTQSVEVGDGCKFTVADGSASLEITETEWIATWNDAGTLRTFRLGRTAGDDCMVRPGRLVLAQDGGGDPLEVTAPTNPYTSEEQCFSYDEYCINWHMAGLVNEEDCGYIGVMANGDYLKTGRMSTYWNEFPNWDADLGWDAPSSVGWRAYYCKGEGRTTSFGRHDRITLYYAFTPREDGDPEEWVHKAKYRVTMTQLAGGGTGSVDMNNPVFKSAIWESPIFGVDARGDGEQLDAGVFKAMYDEGTLPPATLVSHEVADMWFVDPTASTIYAYMTRDAPIDSSPNPFCDGQDCDMDPAYAQQPAVSTYVSNAYWVPIVFSSWPDTVTVSNTNGWSWQSGHGIWCFDETMEYTLNAVFVPDSVPSGQPVYASLHYETPGWISLGDDASYSYWGKFEVRFVARTASNLFPRVWLYWHVYWTEVGTGDPDTGTVVDDEYVVEYVNIGDFVEGEFGQPCPSDMVWPDTSARELVGEERMGIDSVGFNLQCYYDGPTGDGSMNLDFGA